MSDQALIPIASAALERPASPSIDALIVGWLEQKEGRTQSERTGRAYRETLADFRQFLQRLGADLDRPASHLAPAAEKWAAKSAHAGKIVAASTYNQRLAIISSFFTYWQQMQQDQEIPNPIARCKRRPVQEYASATPLSTGQLAQLGAIDRSTPAGTRDYALLAVALSTGRRAAELAALRKETADGQPVIRVDGRSVSLYFKRTKGGKKTRDTLLPGAASAVLAWISLHYGSFEAMPAGAPLWPALGHNPKGRRAEANPELGISTQAIADICSKHLGTSKVHTTRHTFAHKMDEAGARVTDIAAKLQHSNLQTTSRYLAQLSSAENPYAEQLEKLLGL